MRTNILAIAVALPDRDLLARLDALAATEREAMAEMVAHLAALERRPSLYLAQGYGSLFEYCTRARTRSSARSGGATGDSAPSWVLQDTGASSAISWSSTISGPTHWTEPRPWTTSPFGAGRHNAFESELVFGPRGPSTISEMRAVYQAGGD
jgi:hypothetical protein